MPAKKLKTCTEYELFIPITSRKSPQNNFLSSFRDELVEYFGGLTDTRHPNKGIWKRGHNKTYDKIVVWKLVSSRGNRGDKKMLEIKQKLEAKLGEDEILIIRRLSKKL